jgi:hypothetical protein
MQEKNPIHISSTPPKACKPKNDHELGYFLAGLIDSDGTMTKPGYIRISFHTNEVSVAYYLKKVLGSEASSVCHEKKRFASIFSSSSKIISLKIANLIRNKLRHPEKIKQYNERIAPKFGLEPTDKPTGLTPPDLFSNHWP